MRKLLLLLLALVFSSSSAAADIIIFKSGSAKEGIVEEETPTGVKIRVKNAVIGVSWRNIEKIEYATPQENRNLDLKWKEQERKRQEKRKQRREEEERFEKEQKDKGLVKHGDRWVTRKEKADLEEKGIREKMEAERAARLAREAAEAREAEAAEEAEEPGFLSEMTEEERREYKENLKKVGLSNISVVRLGEDATMWKARVTNKGQFTAKSIFLEITLYDKNGEAVAVGFSEVADLAPGASIGLNVPIDVPAEFVSSSKTRVVGVEWR